MNRIIRSAILAVVIAPLFLSQMAFGQSGLVLGATGLMEDQFTRVLQNGYRDKAKALGIKVLVSNSQSSVEKESESINTFMQAGIKGLIIEPVSPDASAAIAKQAAAKGIIVFACAIPVNSDAIFASSINDNYDLGSSTGKAAVLFLDKKFGKTKKIKCAILAYDSQDSVGSGQRIDGFKDMVKAFNIEYVSRQEGFMPDKAVAVAGDILTANPDINLIYCANEGGVIGAVNAVKAAKMQGKVFVFGVDCSVQICDMLLSSDNICQAVTAQDPYAQGQYAVQALYDYLVKNKAPAVKHLKVANLLVTRMDPSGIKTFAANWKTRSGE
ncbi:MAG: substrate-binding domain-containing protein [Rectinemataceae bacterium]